MSRYRFIDGQRATHPVRLLCRVLRVPASGYYAWQHAQQQKAAQRESAWETALVKAFKVHKSCCGTRRLRIELRRKNYRVGRQRGATGWGVSGYAPPCAAGACMRCNPRPFPHAPRTRPTDSIHGLRCAPNRLLDQPKPTQANRVWVSDTTCLPLANSECAYLCAFQSMASKQVMGGQVGASMPEEWVTRALQRAFWAQPPALSLIVYSDRGRTRSVGQYCGNAYRQLLHDHLALRSQSRRGRTH